MEQIEHITSDDDLKKYRTETPNIVDDLGLSPHAFRVYGHYRRACGANSKPCTQSTKTIAGICSMSTGKVSEAKKELVTAGLIQITESTGKLGVQHSVVVRNIWSINFAYFDKQITLDQAKDKIRGVVQNMNGGVQNMNDYRSQYELKKEQIQERTIEESLSAIADVETVSSDTVTVTLISPKPSKPAKTPKPVKRLHTTAAKDELLPVLVKYGKGRTLESYSQSEVTILMKTGMSQVLTALQPLDDEKAIDAMELDAAFKWFKRQYKDASYPCGANTVAKMLSDYRAYVRNLKSPKPTLATPAIDGWLERQQQSEAEKAQIAREIEAMRASGNLYK